MRTHPLFLFKNISEIWARLHPTSLLHWENKLERSIMSHQVRVCLFLCVCAGGESGLVASHSFPSSVSHSTLLLIHRETNKELSTPIMWVCWCTTPSNFNGVFRYSIKQKFRLVLFRQMWPLECFCSLCLVVQTSNGCVPTLTALLL